MKSLLSGACLLFLCCNLISQPATINSNKKGTVYFYWGWNRGHYTNSDITLKGDYYNFTLENVVAKDRQSHLGMDPYFNIGKISIPQTNFRIGYFINDKYSISFGDDHMKYVMVQNQTVSINGRISGKEDEYAGVYDNEEIVLKENFLIFEHTDGLNYLNIELARHQNLPTFWPGKFYALQFEVLGAVGIGALVPKTNATLLGNTRHDAFHLSGGGVSAKAGIALHFFKYLFVQSELKGGYINMPDIRTTQFDSDKASQSFYFYQYNIVVGGRFNINRK